MSNKILGMDSLGALQKVLGKNANIVKKPTEKEKMRKLANQIFGIVRETDFTLPQLEAQMNIIATVLLGVDIELVNYEFRFSAIAKKRFVSKLVFGNGVEFLYGEKGTE